MDDEGLAMTHTHSDAAILAALQAGAVLTPAIAAEKWGCLALHSAISRIRERGHTITCTLRTENGRRFGSYRLTGENRELPAGGENPPTSYPPSQSSREVARPYAAQPSRSNSRVTEDSSGGEPSGAVAAAGKNVSTKCSGLCYCAKCESTFYGDVRRVLCDLCAIAAARKNAAGRALPSVAPADSESGSAVGSAPVAPEIIHLNGKPHEVVFEGVSAYDGTRYCSVIPA